MFGWRGRLLRVNLTSGVIQKESLEPPTARAYIGGRGLGVHLHAKEVPASVDPLGAGNHLIFATGPLTGTLAPNGGRYAVITRTRPAGALAAVSISGKWGPELKFAGFDAIIFEGSSERPVYLWINDGKAELRNAEHASGKTVTETTGLLLKETDPRAVVSCIGPAGEKKEGCAVIVSDGFSAAGKDGAGAVMGSKNLKAVAVRGTQGFRLADYRRFLMSATGLRSSMKSKSIAMTGARPHDSVLIADTIVWDSVQQGTQAARTRGCFGCATSFSGFTADDGKGFFPLEAGIPPSELSERLKEYRSSVDMGLDFAAAKAEGKEKGSRSLIERGPCMAAGYAIFPRVPAADGQDETLSGLMAVLDSAGLCPFLCGAIGMDEIAELLTAATGVGFSQQDVVQAAQRISRLLSGAAE
jgi:aldehyde:ferredoxin oxidoreductase